MATLEAKNVLQRYLKNAAEESEESVELGQEVRAERLIDLINLAVCFGVYTELLESKKTISTPMLVKGTALIKRYADELFAGVNAHLASLADRPDSSSLHALFNKALRSGNVIIQVHHQAKLFRALLPWLKVRTAVFNGIFTGRASRPARALANIFEEASPASLLNQAAAVAPVSGLSAPRKWIENVAAEAGVPLKPVEGMLVDTQMAQALGQDLAAIEQKITSTSANTPEAADLQAQRVNTIAEIQKMADRSGAPDAVIAAVASARPSHQYATEIGKRLGHTPEQETAMMARGRGIIAAGAGSGKCIRGDILVQTEKGFIPIAELCDGLVAEQDAPLQMYINGVNGPEQTSHAYYDGVRETLRIETSQGYEQEGTAPHRILTISDGKLDWTCLQDIQVGDVVCLDRRPGLFAESPFKRLDNPIKLRTNATANTNIPTTLTPQVARLLGYIVSEGYVRKDCWYVGMTTTDMEQLERYRESVAGLIQCQERLDDRHRRQYLLEFKRHADVQALLDFGLTREKADVKEIPAGILRSPKPIVTEFLRALFDGDGWISNSTVGYCTASTKMAEQLQTLLLAYGIPARRRFRPNACSGAWHLFITGKGLRRFAAEIGFNLKHKQDPLLEQASKPENTNVDVIPGIADLCRTIKDQYKDQYGTTKTDDPWQGTAKCLCNGSRCPSYGTLARFLDFYKVESPEWEILKSLGEKEWFFDQVIGIEKASAEVYDFVVPGTHSFSAGGFINHNTRVLASKVAYHINELGVNPQSIMATTFTNKATAELLARINKFGGIIEKSPGFGNTHQICGRLLNTSATQYRRENYLSKKENWKQVTILRLAMEQVKMKGAVSPAPRPQGFWENKAVTDQPQIDTEYSDSIQHALGYFKWAAGAWGVASNYGPARPEAAAWAANMVKFLYDMSEKSPDQLTDNQKKLLNDVFSKVKGRQGIITYRVPTGARVAAAAPAPSPRGKRQSKLDQYQFAKVPARQWFNLGLKLTREVKKAEVPIPLGEFKNALAIMKGHGLSPSEVWEDGLIEEDEVVYEPNSDFAAVYAAYEWLKGAQGEPEFRNTGDMDDILIDTVTALVNSPRIRGQIQRQYKVFLIDEAQDLNNVQHLLFGMMAGYLDPQTLSPWPDEHMTADTFCYIGDDKQAIYGFRGAVPGKFIGKSDLVPGGENFPTYQLDTNFRSGSAIVEAANKLIAHNKRQIPMVCRAVEDKNGTGKVVSRFMETTEEAAMNIAEEIADLIESGEASKYDSKEMRGGYASFGVALRSNSEAYAYGLEMLKRGIPFKSNANFFSDPNTKALIGWMTLAELGLDGSPELLEESLRDCVKAPYSKIGPTLFTTLDNKATGSWPRWLIDNESKKVYSHPDMIENLNHLKANLSEIAGITGTPPQILEKVMMLKGIDGETMQDSMIHSVEENEDLMASLEAEAEDGVVTPEMIKEQAMAPVAPLIGLMKGKEDLGAAMTYVRKLRKVNEKISSRDTDEEIDRDAVTIGTMHSWKGLEIPTMYIPMMGGKFPRVTTSQRLLAEERRLAYVAITRAEQKAVIMDIPHPKLKDSSGYPLRSQFIKEACIPSEGSSNKVKPGKTASMGWVEIPHTIFEGGKVSEWDDEACNAAMMKINELDLEESWN